MRIVSAAHLFRDTHVGKATPFSMLFPLKTFATALHRQSLPQQDQARHTNPCTVERTSMPTPEAGLKSLLLNHTVPL